MYQLSLAVPVALKLEPRVVSRVLMSGSLRAAEFLEARPRNKKWLRFQEAWPGFQEHEQVPGGLPLPIGSLRSLTCLGHPSSLQFFKDYPAVATT